MSADRYELRADHTDWMDVRDPQGYRNTINQPGAVALIRQQARDIAELRAELQMCCELKREYQERAAVAAEQADQLRADLAAAVAARANMDTDRLEWMTRAEQAEARLAAIEAAPVVASVGHGDYLHRHTANVPVGTLLIARPAKD